DLAVADVDDLADVVAYAGDAERDGLDDARGVQLRRLELDAVADAVLVLEDHEDAVEVVLDQRLGAEAHGDADDTGAGDERGHVDAHLVEQHDPEDRDDHPGRQRPREAADGPRALRQAYRSI